jgi:LysR family glycine cleavage system transcriptional activator
MAGTLDLRDDASGVEIHLGLGEYPGYRSDRLFGVRMVVVANPEIGNALKKPEDLSGRMLLHDDAMDLVAHGNAWQKWLEAAGAAEHVDAAHGPHFSSNILSLEAASQKLGVALALRPLVNDDIASGRLVAPFDIEVKPIGSYYLVCPEVIAERPAVATFRKWLLEKAGNSV